MRRKRTFLGTASIAGAALLVVMLPGCTPAEQPFALPPPVVSSLEVRPQALPIELEYAAQLRGIREIEVRARVSGILLDRLYDEGAAVKAGDVLFRLDAAPFRAEAERARAELGVRQAELRQAERERDRIVPLQERGVASLRDRDVVVARYESAQAAVAAAQAALRTAELALSYTEVRAPIDGQTSREVRSEGSLVTAGDDSSLLTYLVQADRLYVEFSIPDADAEVLRAALLTPEAKVSVQVIAAGGPVPNAARIEFLAPRVDDATGTVAVRALLDNDGGKLLPGQVVRARIDGVAVSDALVIPRRAVLRGAQGAFVWKIDTANSVVPTPIELGIGSGNDTTIRNGLTSGDRIVVDGILKVQPGAPVNATPLESAVGRNSNAGG